MSVSFIDVISAIEQALTSDPGLHALLKGEKVYPWAIPGKRALSYITFTFPGVTDRDAKWWFARQCHSGVIQLDIWSDGAKNAARIYAEMERVLHEVKLTLPGGQSLIEGLRQLIFIMPDPGDDTIHHGVTRYEWTTVK